jgi:hypothetical protein
MLGDLEFDNCATPISLMLRRFLIGFERNGLIESLSVPALLPAGEKEVESFLKKHPRFRMDCLD